MTMLVLLLIALLSTVSDAAEVQTVQIVPGTYEFQNSPGRPDIVTEKWTYEQLSAMQQDVGITAEFNRLDDIIDICFEPPHPSGYTSPYHFFFIERDNSYVNYVVCSDIDVFPSADDAIGRIDLVTSSSDVLMHPTALDSWVEGGADNDEASLVVADAGGKRLVQYSIDSEGETFVDQIVEPDVLIGVSAVAKWESHNGLSRHYFCALSWGGTVLSMFANSTPEFRSSFGLAERHLPEGAPPDDQVYFFGRATSLTSQHDKLYVCDADRSAILRFGLTDPPIQRMVYETTYFLEPGSTPIDICGDGDGNLFVLDSATSSILKFTTRTPTGSLIGPLILVDTIENFGSSSETPVPIETPLAVTANLCVSNDNQTALYITESMDATHGIMRGRVDGRLNDISFWTDRDNPQTLHLSGMATGNCEDVTLYSQPLDAEEGEDIVAHGLWASVHPGPLPSGSYNETRPYSEYKVWLEWRTLPCDLFDAECRSPCIPAVVTIGQMQDLTETASDIRCCSEDPDEPFAVCWNPLPNVNGYRFRWRPEGGTWSDVSQHLSPHAFIGALPRGQVFQVSVSGFRYGQVGPAETALLARDPVNAPYVTILGRDATRITVGFEALDPIYENNGFRIYYGPDPDELGSDYKDVFEVTDEYVPVVFDFIESELPDHDRIWYFRVAGGVFDNQGDMVASGPPSGVLSAAFAPTTTGTITWAERWFSEFDPVVNLSGSLAIGSGGSLTIDPGTTVNLAQGAHIRSFGHLTAIGSGTDSIRFVGSNPQYPGALLETFQNSVVDLDRVAVTNGWFGYLCRGSSVSITDSRFSQNRHGLVMVGAAPIIEESSFLSNSGYGAVVVRSNPVFNECSLQSNQSAGLLVWNSDETQLYGNSINLNGGNSPNVWNSGIRMLNGYVDMRCNELSQNNGPGLSILQGYADMVTDPGITPGGRNKLTNNCTNSGLVNFGQVFLQGTAALDLDYGWNTFSGAQLISSLMTYDPIPPSDPNVPVQLYTFLARGNYWGTTDINSIQQRLPSISVVEPILTQQIVCPNLGPPDPNDSPSRVLFEQGLVLEHSANADEAVLRYKSIVKDYPKSKEASAALQRMAICYKLMNYTWPQTRAYFISMADTIDPVIKMAALNTAAWCLVEMGDMNAARSEFQSLIDMSLKDYDILYNSMGKLMTELEDEDWGSLGTAGTKSKTQVAKSGTNFVKQPENPSEQKLAISLSRALESLDSLLGVSSGQPRGAVPTNFSLYQNYPNPFNPNTEIRFDIPEVVRVELKIFNILGQEVRTLVDDVRAAGAYRILWDGKNAGGLNVASGVYVYQLKAGNFQDAKKMILLR